MEIRPQDIQEFAAFAADHHHCSWEDLTARWISNLRHKRLKDSGEMHMRSPSTGPSLVEVLDACRKEFEASGGRFLGTDEVRAEVLRRRGGIETE